MATRRQYMFQDVSVVLTAEPDDDAPYVTIHIDKKGALQGTALGKLKRDLVNILVQAYNSFELPTHVKQIETEKSTGYQISFNGKDTDTKPSPEEFFNVAKTWLDNLTWNILTSGSFNEGMELTKRDIKLNTPQPDPDDPDERAEAWKTGSTLKKNEYAIGDVHFEIEETHTDGKYLLNFHEDMAQVPDITAIYEKLKELLVKNFAFQGTKITISDDTESGMLNFIIRTDDSLSSEDFLSRCDRLVNEVHITTNRQHDVLKGIQDRIDQLETAYRKNQRYSIEKALEDAFGNLPNLPEAAKQQKAAIAKELAAAVLQPYTSVEVAMDNIREGKGLSDDDQIKARLRDALAKHIPITDKNEEQIRYYIGELASALYAAIPNRDAAQRR